MFERESASHRQLGKKEGQDHKQGLNSDGDSLSHRSGGEEHLHTRKLQILPGATAGQS